MNPYVNSESIAEKARFWLKEIAPFNQHEMKLNKATCALLVVDMQEFFLEKTPHHLLAAGLKLFQMWDA